MTYYDINGFACALLHMFSLLILIFIRFIKHLCNKYVLA